MSKLYDRFTRRWRVVSVSLLIILALFVQLDRAAATQPPPFQGVTSSNARADSGARADSDTRADPRLIPDAPEYSGCGGVDQPIVNADFDQQVLDLVNAERAKQDLPPYKRVADLDRSARYHSADMGQDNYFDHNTYDRSGGTLVYVCDTWTRIGKYYSGAMGENIAAGYSTPQDVMTAWMNSSGHRANILSTNNWEIGIGYANISNSTYHAYWTQDFGRRSGVYPLIVNRDAASTASRSVPIYIYGSFQQMRLKNDGDAWGAWQTFSNSFNWTLNNSIGTHTVAAELKSGSAVVSTSDTIYLSQADPAQLGNLPSAVTFLYSIPEHKLAVTSVTLQPANTSSSQTLIWSLSQTGTWFTLSTTSGSTPQTLQITPSAFNTSTAGTYTGQIVVTVTSPAGVLNSPYTINVTLKVINAPFHYVQLPLIVR